MGVDDFLAARDAMGTFDAEWPVEGSYAEIDDEGVVWIYDGHGAPRLCCSLEAYQKMMA